ncbi:MAG: ParD-like family protein [Verrucomicrobia bacterium]|nr:ParD-like family protein [Verrucomicrobiota bacterium]
MERRVKKSQPTKSVRLPAELIALVESAARAKRRSVPQQIEYWVRLAMAMEEEGGSSPDGSKEVENY